MSLPRINHLTRLPHTLPSSRLWCVGYAFGDDVVKEQHIFALEEVRIIGCHLRCPCLGFILSVFVNCYPLCRHLHIRIAVDGVCEFTHPFRKPLVAQFVLFSRGCWHTRKHDARNPNAEKFLQVLGCHLRHFLVGPTVLEVPNGSAGQPFAVRPRS